MPRRIHRKLAIEELESRIAPVTLSKLNPIQYFDDADGDRIMVKFSGIGTAHVLFTGGGERPLAGDEISSVDLAGTNLGSTLTIQDVNVGVGGASLLGGAISVQSGADMGLIQLLSPSGVVSDTQLTIPDTWKGLLIRGNADTITIVATRLVQSLTVEGTATDCTFQVGGDLTRALFRNTVTGGTMDVNGAMSSLQLLGGVSGTQIEVDRDVLATKVTGDLLGGARLSVGGKANSLAVSGAINDADLDFLGVTGQAILSGAISNTSTLNFAGKVSTFKAMGGATSAALSFFGGVSNMYLYGGGADTAFTVATAGVGGMGNLYFYGDKANVDLTVTGALTKLCSTGIWGAGSQIVVTGKVAQVAFSGALDGTSTVNLAGNADLLRLTGGITNGSAFSVGGTSTTVVLSGPTGGPCIDGSSSITLNNLNGRLTVAGAMLGTVAVNGAFGAAASMTFSTDLAGTISFGAGIGCPLALTQDIEAGGRIETAGDLMARGKITITGNVNTPGATSIYIAKSVYGSITIGGNHLGILDVDEDVYGTLKARNFDEIDVGVAGTKVGDLMPGAQVIAVGPPGTINHIHLHGRLYGTVSDPTNLVVDNAPLPNIFTLNPGEFERYLDSDRDVVEIRYEGDGSVQVTLVGTGPYRDIAGIVYTGATTNSSLDISVTRQNGNGWTTAGIVDATGQVVGSLSVDGPMTSLVADAIAVGDVISTWSTAAGNVGAITIANDVAGAIQIGGSLGGQIFVGGDVAATGSILTHGVRSGSAYRGLNAPLRVIGLIERGAELAVIRPFTYTGVGNVYIENVVTTPALTEVTLYNLTSPNSLIGAYARVVEDIMNGETVTRPNNDYSDIGADDWALSEVSAYYYVDRFRSYLAFLGYGDKWNSLAISVNNEFDNAYYAPNEYPYRRLLRFGMPDGADVPYSYANNADIVLHEANHGWNDQMLLCGHLGTGGDIGDLSGAIHEGLADYRAASFSNNSIISETMPPELQRNVDNTNRYPQDIDPSDIHITGLIMSGAYWDLRKVVGQTVADTLSLEMLPYLEQIGRIGTSGLEATYDNVYQATLRADTTLYGGAYAADITAAFNAHGIGLPPDATLSPGQDFTFTDSDGDLVTVSYDGTAGTVDIYLVGAVGAYTEVSVIYSHPNADSQLDIFADGSGNNLTPTANLFTIRNVVFGSALVEGPIGALGVGTIAAGETVTNAAAGASGTLGNFGVSGNLTGTLDIGGNVTGNGDITGNLSGTFQIGGNLLGYVSIGSNSTDDITVTSTGQILISGGISGSIGVDGSLAGQIACLGSVLGTAGTDFLSVSGDVLGGAVVGVGGNIVDRSITVGGNMRGALLANQFGDVYIGEVFSGTITAAVAGAGNTLAVGEISGGLVTPADAFEWYIIHP